jgi:conjugative transfer region protein (TIGR03750 family)
MTAREDILADRLNAEPAIFKGCSSSELGVIVGVAALVWLPVSLLLAGLMGAVTMGFGLAGVGVVATVVVTASLFQRLKRNRPDGYFQGTQRGIGSFAFGGLRCDVKSQRFLLTPSGEAVRPFGCVALA